MARIEGFFFLDLQGPFQIRASPSYPNLWRQIAAQALAPAYKLQSTGLWAKKTVSKRLT